MKLRNPFYIENLYQDQPYSSLVLIAPYCDFKCKKCQNLTLSTEKISNFPITLLSAVYNDNSFVDGITVAGLEICLSGEKFIKDLIYLIKLSKIDKVTIYSRFTLNDDILSDILIRLNEIEFIKELYCKTGCHVEGSNKKTINYKDIDNNKWSIELSSDNQDFLIIKGNKWLRF
jgi:hypothetical protein